MTYVRIDPHDSELDPKQFEEHLDAGYATAPGAVGRNDRMRKLEEKFYPKNLNLPKVAPQ